MARLSGLELSSGDVCGAVPGMWCACLGGSRYSKLGGRLSDVWLLGRRLWDGIAVFY